MNDITFIINKLFSVGYAEKHENGYRGIFNTHVLGYVLSDPELKKWLNLLHQSSGDEDKDCTDVHDWNLDLMEDN